jgi:uncharacterized membrane protein
LKRLNREGWIDLTAYALVDEDAEDRPRVREISDRAETIGGAAAKALTGALIGCLRPMYDSAEAWPDGAAGAIRVGLQRGDSALLVMVEDRFAERVTEELETRGLTVRRQVRGDQCEVALRASIEGIKSKIAWLEELLDHESDKATWTAGEGKERLESAIRAGRMELRAARERLQTRLLALHAELETRLLEIARCERGARAAIASGRGIVEVERDLADVNEDLALCVLDHLDALATYESELSEKAARASGDAAEAIEDQLREVEVQMRRSRADLTATLASSGSLAQQSAERSRAISRSDTQGMESKLQTHGRKMEQRHARLKADIQQLQKEDSRTWHGLAAGFHQAWRSLRETSDGLTECQ